LFIFLFLCVCVCVNRLQNPGKSHKHKKQKINKRGGVMSTVFRSNRAPVYFVRKVSPIFHLQHCSSSCYHSGYHSQANSSSQQRTEERKHYEKMKEEYTKYQKKNTYSSLFLWLTSAVPIALIVPLYYAYRYDRIYDDFISSEASTKAPIIQQYLEELHAIQTEAELVQKQISDIRMAKEFNPAAPKTEMENELEYHVEKYRGLIHHMSTVMGRIFRLTDEEFANVIEKGLPLAQLANSNIACNVLRNCILIGLNSKNFLKESPGSETTNLSVQFDIERLHFYAMMTLNRLIVLDDTYAQQVVNGRLLGPCFNTLIRVQSPTLRQIASDLICNLADREVTHDSLIDWISTFKFMVDSRDNLSMFTAVYAITRMLCNDRLRPRMSQVEFLPYINLLSEIFENAQEKHTRILASFGVLIAQGNLKQKKFLKQHEQNKLLLERLSQVMFIVGTSFTWAALRHRLRGQRIAANIENLAKTTIVATLFGSSLIVRNEIKDWITYGRHQQFFKDSDKQENKAIHIPSISLTHAALVALLQIILLRGASAQQLFIMAPYLVHALYLEMWSKNSHAHLYMLYWEHLLRALGEFIF